MKKKLLYGMLAIALCSIGFASSAIYVSAKGDSDTQEEGTIYTGIFIDGVDVSGLTKKEAEVAYEDYVASLQSSNLILTTVNGEVEIPFENLGLEASFEDAVDVAYDYGRTGNILRRYKEINTIKKDNITLNGTKKVDETLVAEALDADTEDLIVEAKSAQLSRRDGEFFCEPGVVGIEILKEDTVAAIEKAVCEDWSEGDLTVAAVVQETQPKYTEADFAKVTD